MIRNKFTFTFDWLLLLVTLALLGLGALLLRSATAGTFDASTPKLEVPTIRQAIFAVVGMVALVAASLINYRIWAVWRWVLYGAIAVALVVVLVMARRNFGARSWFDLATFGLQPSELCKIVMIIVLARYLADHQAEVKQGIGLVTSLVIVVPFFGLVYAQPDMGTTVILVAIWLGMLFVAGMQPRHILLFVVAAIVLAPLLWAIMQDHMRERILMFLHPGSDPSDRDYNVIQALISVGSGGLWGKGLGQGTQNRLFFLRVRHTDYIFAVLAEELGFVGALLLLALFAALLLRIVRVGSQAGDMYGRLITTGVAVMIFVQVVINIGFHVGLLPVTGLPLPLISYGGSSLLTTLLGLGLVESVSLYHQPSEAIPT